MTGDENRGAPKVLIVEDNAQLADLFALWVGETNTVEVAHTYETALDTIDDTLDLALLDRDLPDGSGDDLLEIIRRKELDCRVAMVTAVESHDDICELAFDEYIKKPVSSGELCDAVDRLARRGHVRDEEGELYLGA